MTLSTILVSSVLLLGVAHFAGHAPAKLKIKNLVVGKGKAAKAGETVTVEYTGKLTNGTVFDSTSKPGRGPFTFDLGGGHVIKGWDQGVVGMKVGGVRVLTIPPEFGYGDRAMGPIPAKSTLIFKIKLLKIG